MEIPIEYRREHFLEEWLSLTSAGNGSGNDKEVLIKVDAITAVDHGRLSNGVVCRMVFVGGVGTPVTERISAIRDALERVGAHISVVESGEPVPTIFTAS